MRNEQFSLMVSDLAVLSEREHNQRGQRPHELHRMDRTNHRFLALGSDKILVQADK
jgi:hypothetical protein